MAKKKFKKDFLLRFLLEISKSDMLHFGLWNTGEPLTQANLRRAQEKYTESLLSMIPKSTRDILDVGCGTGNAASRLQGMGYNVDCLSPDIYLKGLIEKNYHGRLNFYCSKFEEFDPERRYDLLLMMESFGYMKLGQAVRKCTETVRSGGKVLIADIFRNSDTEDYREFHVLDRFYREAGRNGFKVMSSVDVTGSVLPTLDYAGKLYDEYVLPISRMAVDYISEYLEKMKLVRLMECIARPVLRKRRIKLMNGMYVKAPRLLSAENFRKKARYMVFMLERAI